MEKRNWLKDNGVGITIITLLVGNFYWTDSKFNRMDERFIVLERDVAIIKTVMLMKNIMPPELAKKEEIK